MKEIFAHKDGTLYYATMFSDNEELYTVSSIKLENLLALARELKVDFIYTFKDGEWCIVRSC